MQLVQRDWQITKILPNDLFIEIDCNSGDERRIRKSKCECGQPVLIEYGTTGFRKDGKRVFYPDDKDDRTNGFRCRNCHKVLWENVPYAELDNAQEQPRTTDMRESRLRVKKITT